LAQVSRHILPIEIAFTKLFEIILAGRAHQGSKGELARVGLSGKAPEEISFHRDFNNFH